MQKCQGETIVVAMIDVKTLAMTLLEEDRIGAQINKAHKALALLNILIPKQLDKTARSRAKKFS